MQNLVATHGCPTFLHAACLPPLPLATSVRAACLPSTSSTCVRLQSFCGTHCCPTFVRATRLPSTSLTCMDTHCRTSSLRTAVLYSYILHVCCLCRWLHPYLLLVCFLHRRPAFACVAELRCYPLLSYIPTRCSYAINIADLHSCVAEPHWYLLLCYIRTCCSYAVNTADLRSHVLQCLTCAHCCSTFAPAAHLAPVLLATFVCAARLPSTSSTCMGTWCRTLSLRTAVLHSYMLHVCCYCRWLHPYMLLVCHLHRRPAWVQGTEPRHSAWLPYIPTCCVYATIAAGYICTHCLSAIYIIDLHSYALQSFVATHCCPTFIRTARMRSTSLTCVRVLQNLVGICCCPTFVRAAHRPSTLSTYIRTHFRASLVPTAVLHSHLLRVCHHYRWLHSYALLVCHQHRRPVFLCVG